MIKQIQLRGISRTPSDRMSEDGGLSESLNMYMDTAENAPAIVPKDSTKDLGLPEDLKAERIFIHKTANYENYIVVQDGRVVAYTPMVEDEEPLTVLDLADGESVNDITSLGNTLIISTSSSLFYILYKERKYTLLGTKLPFPMVDFETRFVERTPDTYDTATFEEDTLWFNGLPSEEIWNKAEWDEEDKATYNHILNNLWRVIGAQIASNGSQNVLSSPLFIRYSLVDAFGSENISMPILLGAGKTNIGNAEIKIGTSIFTDDYEDKHVRTEFSKIETPIPLYKIFAKMINTDELRSWSDVISKIKIYISKGVFSFMDQEKSQMNSRETIYNREEQGPYAYLETDYDIGYLSLSDLSEDLITASSNTFLVKEFDVFSNNSNVFTKEINELIEGQILDVKKFLDESAEDYVQLETQETPSISCDMQHYEQTGGQLATYNNQLILFNSAQLIDYDYNNLNSLGFAEGGEQEEEITYDVTYFLHGYVKDKVIKKTFTYPKTKDKTVSVFAFQIFPDSRAYKMVVKATINGQEVRYGEFEMKAHPFLNCAYYYGGIANELVSLCTDSSIEEQSVYNIDDLNNKLLISETDVPYSFPLEQRYTFQSKVLGIAIASTALSQGQFGQYPLYVFTEDGIWAMETAADGSFVSQKPLSREVCCNPASITAIDNAVVFVTDKAVMLIQGAQVMNISPYMNGKHYIPNDSARNIIAKQDGFAIFDSAISDTTPFMAFMKKASIAYDYTGQRLICFASDEIFQYVYKLDTQTWHKTMFSEINLDTPLNSYPECLVLGSRNKEHQHIYNLSTVLDTTEIQQTAKGILITRPFDLGMPDVYKSITNIKIRGDYEKGSVRHILQGSDNGRDFFTLTSLRGKSWKMFRIFILADLEPTERISWIDIDFEPRYNNRLR